MGGISKNKILFGTAVICNLLLLGAHVAHGRNLLERLSSSDHRRPPRSVRSPQSSSSSTITESQQTTGGSSGFVNSTAEGNGEPGSATAYAWQGGQTSASSDQLATADKNSTAQSTGFSTCTQGYSGNAGGKNSTAANSIGQALCNATYSQEGTHQANSGTPAEPSDGTKAQFGSFPSFPTMPNVVTMNHTSNQIGEAVSGQTHNSNSNVNTGHMNIFAGGWANAPQGGMTFTHSALDPYGQPVLASQDFQTEEGLNSEEHTFISTGSLDVGHNSGGVAHVYGLGTQTNSSYNSHAQEEEDQPKKNNGRPINLTPPKPKPFNKKP